MLLECVCIWKYEFGQQVPCALFLSKVAGFTALSGCLANEPDKLASSRRLTPMLQSLLVRDQDNG